MYLEFVENILLTRGRFNVPEGTYKERHHILPRCMGGDDSKENLIDLTAEEHYTAHKYLFKENPTEYGLATAWFRMCFKNGKPGMNDFVSEEEYAEIREICGRMHSDRISGEGNPFYGKKHTQETKDKISKSKTNPSDEIRKHLSDAQKKVDHSFQVERMAEFNRTQRDYSTQGAKISATKQASGIGNGRKDKFKVTNGEINKFIRPSELDLYRSLGYEIANEKQYRKYLRLLDDEQNNNDARLI